jgi:predicted ATP-dependent endonuclease of OLD family
MAVFGILACGLVFGDQYSSRLDLRKVIMLNSGGNTPVLLKDLNEETAKFFMKAPDNNILELILSPKVILVEGDAEFILLENFFNNLTGQNINQSSIHVLSVDGTSFKRYLDLARLLRIKTALVRDNDGDSTTNCVERYKDYDSDLIKVFYDSSDDVETFEVAMYNQNTEICDELFGENRRTLSVLDYMLKNKTDAAFELLEKRGNEILAPDYIRSAIEWINQ